MSQDMRGRSWRSLAASAASSRIASFKGYLAQQDIKNSLPNTIQRQLGPRDESNQNDNKQTWREWAGQKMKRGNNLGTEKIALFPGWATRRPRSATDGSFEIDIFVSGFASSHRGLELASRSQRTFMRLAKGFAALPKLGDDSRTEEDFDLLATKLTPSTEELLRTVDLPPRPEEMTVEREMEMIEQQLKRMKSPKQDLVDSDDSNSSRSSSPSRESPPSIDYGAEKTAETQNPLVAAASISDDLLRKLHANLEARLLPFWSSVLPGRMVRVSIFAPSQNPDTSSPDHQHLAVKEVQTGVDGSFQTLFRIRWEDICHHPAALHIAFGDPSDEHEFSITAELLSNRKSGPASSSTNLTLPTTLPPAATSSICVPLTHSSVRVISDIDDTVKHSDILGGARSVFRNVFVNELEDLVIPGMGDWYTEMWKKGARFHYVSNGPFELLPILGDFFAIANLPPGSIKLKSYAGRSLFSGLLSAPAARKRAGVQDILDAFPASSFILVGDSGEQDLELYTELAKENPQQILAIFIRDTGTGDPLDDPTGSGAMLMTPELELPDQIQTPTVDQETWRYQPYVSGDKRPAPIDTSRTPQKASSWSVSNKTPTTNGINTRNSNYFKSSQLTAEPEQLYDSSRNSSLTSLASIFTRKTPTTPRGSMSSNPSSYFSRTPKSSTSTSTTTSNRMSEPERRRKDLQMRVYRCRMALPDHVVLRVFRSPTECVEAETILTAR